MHAGCDKTSLTAASSMSHAAGDRARLLQVGLCGRHARVINARRRRVPPLFVFVLLVFVLLVLVLVFFVLLLLAPPFAACTKAEVGGGQWRPARLPTQCCTSLEGCRIHARACCNACEARAARTPRSPVQLRARAARHVHAPLLLPPSLLLTEGDLLCFPIVFRCFPLVRIAFADQHERSTLNRWM